VRLRRLSEAECYARCYGGRRDDRVSFVRVLPRAVRRPTVTGEQLREHFEARLDGRGPEPEEEAA
jgi:hypothetical protein